MNDTDNKEKNINFLQVGQTQECGHCHPEKYAEGLALAEANIPNFKCDCICHTPPTADWEKQAKQIMLNEIIEQKFIEHFIDFIKSTHTDLARTIRDDLMGKKIVDGEDMDIVLVEDITSYFKDRFNV